MLKGDIPTVDQVVIMTAQNPMGELQPAEVNNKLNAKLRADLRQSNFIAAHRKSNKNIIGTFGGEINIKGKFGNIEDSFLIPHMSRETAIHYARKYKQKAVIWGKKQTKDGLTFIRFEYIESTDPENIPYKTVDVRDVVLAGQDVQDRDDYFTAINASDKSIEGKEKKTGGNRKLAIPFFDPKFKHAKYGLEKKSIDTDEKEFDFPANKELRKAEFYIPFIDDSVNDAEFELSENVSFSSFELNDASEELIEDVKRYSSELKLEGMTSKHYWSMRGLLNNSLEKLKNDFNKKSFL